MLKDTAVVITITIQVSNKRLIQCGQGGVCYISQWEGSV